VKKYIVPKKDLIPKDKFKEIQTKCLYKRNLSIDWIVDEFGIVEEIATKMYNNIQNHRQARRATTALNKHQNGLKPQIEALLKLGYKNKEIIKLLGCSKGLVSQVKARMTPEAFTYEIESKSGEARRDSFILDCKLFSNIAQSTAPTASKLRSMNVNISKLEALWSNLKTTSKDIFMGTIMQNWGKGFKPGNGQEFITINKLQDNAERHSDELVERMDSFLFEMDTDCISDQNRLAYQLAEKGIVNRVVYSGGKSLHCRITIKDSPETKEQYKWIWNQLNDIYFNNKADRACSNPARLTRLPNGIRNNGVRQIRLYLSESTLNFDWRNLYNEEIQWSDNFNKVKYNNLGCFNYNYSREHKDDWQTILNNDKREQAQIVKDWPSISDGERHQKVWTVVSYLKWAGATEDEALNYINQNQNK
jgi:hypothetical protein